MRKNENRTVYTTEQGRICSQCGRPVANCTCSKSKSVLQGDGVVRVRVELKGRKGKTVTTISGVLLDEPGLKKLATDLKQMCGAGGAVKDGVIEVQGDHAGAVIEALKTRGFTAKRAGG